MNRQFLFRFNDPEGPFTISQAMMLFNTAVDGRGACYVVYSDGQLGLVNDAGTGSSFVTPGSSATVENSQCILRGTGSSISNTFYSFLSIGINLTFKPTFGGTKVIYANAIDRDGMSAGWQVLGTWTVPSSNLPPSAARVHPESGAGLAGSFYFDFDDQNGATTISQAMMLFNTGVDGREACYVVYTNGLFRLVNDAGTGSSSLAPNSAATVENSQCTLNGTRSLVVVNSGRLSIFVDLTFKPAFAGTKNVYSQAIDVGGLSSGWRIWGIWAVPRGVPPRVEYVAPNNDAGLTRVFGFSFSDLNGPSTITQAMMLFNTAVDGRGACYVVYADGRLGLVNDAGTGSSFVTPGSSATVENSQCTLSGTGSLVTESDRLYVRLDLTFKPTFGGTKVIHANAIDSDGMSSGWQVLGTWTIPSNNLPPRPVYLFPDAFQGSFQNFFLEFVDPDGASTISQAMVLFNSAVDARNGCQVVVADGQLGLVNDAGTGSSFVAPNSFATVENSQCILSGTGSSIFNASERQSLRVNLTFKPAFAGAKNIYLQAIDRGGLSSGWQLMGTWRVP